MKKSVPRLQQQTALYLVLLLALPPAAVASVQSPPAPQPFETSAAPQTSHKGQQQQTAPQPPDADPQHPAPPVGTAAAPSVKPEGAPASRPAGAAIAPAKQRRIRSFSIRVALLVGAAIAIGTVVALSAGSSSRPN